MRRSADHTSRNWAALLVRSRRITCAVTAAMALRPGAPSFTPRASVGAAATSSPPLARVDYASCAAHYKLSCLPFLPCDNEAGSGGGASDAVTFANDDIGALLRMPYAHFVAMVVYDPSVRRLIDTFLQHRRRAFEHAVSCPAGFNRTGSACVVSNDVLVIPGGAMHGTGPAKWLQRRRGAA